MQIHRRPEALLYLILAGALVLPAVLFASAAWVGYSNAHAVADERIERSLDLLEVHTLKVFQVVERTIAQVEEIVRDQSNTEILADEPRIHPLLKQIEQTVPEFQSIWILDRGGKALASSIVYPLPQQLDLSDRDYFRAHVRGDTGLYVGEVLNTRNPNVTSTIFTLSKARLAPDGTFAGVIMVSLPPAYFSDFYSNFDLGPGSYFSMQRADGTFLVRHPPPAESEQIDENRQRRAAAFAEFPERRLYTLQSRIDGIERRIGWRKLPGYPVYVLVGLETRTVANAWRATMASHLTFGLPATIFLIGVTWLAIQRTRRLGVESERREAAEGTLAQVQKLDVVGQLTSGVAHDFNNLLTVILGNLEIAERNIPVDERKSPGRLSRALERARGGAQRAAELTQRLLAFSRRQPLDPKPLNVNKLANELTDLLRRTIGEGIEIEVVGAAGLWQVEADPAQLESAILNLALNARDAMPEGGKLTIETSNAFLDEEYCRHHVDVSPGQYVMVSVSDTGTGMTPDVRERAFEPFFTTKGAGHGSGLGLSQIYGFVKQSGGHVKIYSEVGHGTTVKIYLPRLVGKVAEPEPAPAPIPGAANGELVLVVEDDEAVRAYVVEILSDLGYQVIEAADAAEAKAIAGRAERTIDLLLTDVILPGQNGRQLAEELLASQPGLRVLYMTGYSRNAIIHQGRLDAGVQLIQKPLTQSALAEKVRMVLG